MAARPGRRPRKAPQEIAPYHLLPFAYEAVSEVVRSWLQAFRGAARTVA